jgi:hypothetical protein
LKKKETKQSIIIHLESLFKCEGGFYNLGTKRDGIRLNLGFNGLISSRPNNFIQFIHMSDRSNFKITSWYSISSKKSNFWFKNKRQKSEEFRIIIKSVSKNVVS